MIFISCKNSIQILERGSFNFMKIVNKSQKTFFPDTENHPSVLMEATADMKYQLCQFHLEQCFIRLKKTISDIYVRISVSPLPFRDIPWKSNNNHHSVLSNPDNKNIYIHNYYQETMPTFMLAL